MPSATKRTAEQRQLLERIRLLCVCGAGLQAIAGPLCIATRAFLGADAGSLFWVDEYGSPAGFFHETAPAALKEMFVTRLELFVDPDETTMMTLIRGEGPLIAKMLLPGRTEHFWTGNVYRHLCVPLDHHYLLDVAIRGRRDVAAAFIAWNGRDRPFDADDARAIEPVQRLMERAAAVDGTQTLWVRVGNGDAHFVADFAGERMLSIHPEAEAALMQSHLLGQNVPHSQRPVEAPAFARLLAAQLASEPVAEMAFPIANGRLVARASRTRAIGGSHGDQLMFVALHREVARNVMMVEYVLGLPLTPFQREIALFGLVGGAREACLDEFGVSREALKKHVRAILQAAGLTRWSDLSLLDPAAAV